MVFEATESQPLISASLPSDDTENMNAYKGDKVQCKVTATVAEDAMEILKLVGPIFISRISWVGVSHFFNHKVFLSVELFFM